VRRALKTRPWLNSVRRARYSATSVGACLDRLASCIFVALPFIFSGVAPDQGDLYMRPSLLISVSGRAGNHMRCGGRSTGDLFRRQITACGFRDAIGGSRFGQLSFRLFFSWLWSSIVLREAF